MSEKGKFQAKEIVWAKVSDHPWWPGKIVKCLEQDNRNVYKVNFFGDSSYCYLHEQCVVPFEEKKIPTPECDQWDESLKNPLQLVLAAISKNAVDSRKSPNAVQVLRNQSDQQAMFCEDTKIQSKENIELLSKIDDQAQQPPLVYENDLDKLISTQVSTENVVAILQSGISVKLNKFKGYNHRKRAFDYKNQLEQHLIFKYGLLIPPTKPAKSRPFQKYQLHHAARKRTSLSLKARCIRHIYQILRRKQVERVECEGVACRVVQQAEEKSKGDALQFRRLFVDIRKKVIDAENFEIVKNLCSFSSQIVTEKSNSQYQDSGEPQKRNESEMAQE